jgi:hypothetical protein
MQLYFEDEGFDGQLRPLGDPNPLLRSWEEGIGQADESRRRDDAIATYAFAVPDDPALETVRRVSTDGVVELGAGTGYWARLLSDRGVDVIAFDVAPASSPENPWFASSPAWYDVRVGDHDQVGASPGRTLLIVWPTKNEDWPGDALVRFAAAGGTSVVYVGEGPNEHTGDDRFHALVGAIDRCWSCAYGVTATACVCGVVPLFTPTEVVALPHWTGFEDDLHVLERAHDARPLGPSPVRGAERRTRHGSWWRRR